MGKEENDYPEQYVYISVVTSLSNSSASLTV